MATIRLTGWTAIEVAERAGMTLSKATDETEGAREGLTPGDARAVAAEDPSLISIEMPVSGGRVDVGGGKVWMEHPAHGWIEMPARYDAERVTEGDLVHDSQLRTLSDREVRDIVDGGDSIEPSVEVTSVYLQGAVGLLAAGEVDAAAGAVDVAARSLGDDHPEVQAMRDRVLAAAGGQPIDAGAFRPYRHRAWGSEIKAALTAAGITGLRLSLYADGAGAVVNDGTCLWTCRPERLLRAAESMVEDGTAERLARLDGDDQAGRYTELCRRAGYLVRGNEEARALHERVVAEWREENPGCEGNWS